MLLLAWMLCVAQAPQVTGLHAGESVIVLDESTIPAKDDKRLFIRPRVLDALTGAPIAGVKIETWTEAGVTPTNLQLRLDVGTTGSDGCARVCMSDGTVRTDKVRFSKAGYASREDSTSEAFDGEMRMYPARTLEGRVLDLEGHPVMGAIVRTRYTCAHAIPASETRTDALGRFRMDDYPPLSPEVEVIDMHHEPLFQRNSADWWTQASFYGQLDLYVARRRPIDLQLVSADGTPVPNRYVLRTEAPSSGAWTDDEGRCLLPPSQEPFEMGGIELSDPIGSAQLYPLLFVDGLPTRAQPALVTDDRDPTGRVAVHLSGLDGTHVPLIVLAPEKGHFIELRPDDECAAPLGSSRILVGGPFTGFLQESRDVVITSDAQSVDIKLRREPRLRIHMGDRSELRLVVQAGDDSIEAPVDGIAREGNMCEQGVPPGVPITILWELDDGGLRRVFLPPIDKDADVDLEAESSILRHGMSEATPHMTQLKFVLTDSDGRPIPDAEGSVSAGPTSIDLTPGIAGAFDWSLQAHAHYQISFEASGYTSAFVEGVVPLKSPDQPTHIVLTHRALLEITGRVTLVDGFLGGSDATDGGIVMEVAPGPLTLVLARDNQPPIALDLTLAPNESRHIEVH